MKVEITSTSVQKLQLATKVDDTSGELLCRVSVESKLAPEDIARLLNLQKNKAPVEPVETTKALESTVPVNQVDPNANGAKPKRRSRKVSQGALTTT